MSEYIPKDKVLELWWYWKFIEAYDQTKAMKGIDLDDYVPREWHDRVCEEMAKRHTADRPKGEWKPKNHHTDYCSNCGFEETQWRTVNYKFCPYCGADMKGADDETD